MEKITFDSGVKAYKLGDGVLRFNPADPNLYARFMEAAEKIKALEEELSAQGQEASGQAALTLLQSADQKMKETLNWVFGEGADFDNLLGGVNLLAMGSNGERVATNLFDALEPVLVAGAKSCAAGQVQTAVNRAKARRAKQ